MNPTTEFSSVVQTEIKTKLEIRLENDTLWPTQKLMAELFKTTISNINSHLKNIFYKGELAPGATIKEILIVHFSGIREVKKN